MGLNRCWKDVPVQKEIRRWRKNCKSCLSPHPSLPTPPQTSLESRERSPDTEWSGTEGNCNFNLCLQKGLVGHRGDLLLRFLLWLLISLKWCLKTKAAYGRSSLEHRFLNSDLLQELTICYCLIMEKSPTWHEFEDILRKVCGVLDHMEEHGI